MKLRLLTVIAAALPQTSCLETLRNVPVTFVYQTDIAGHDLTAAYSTKDGLMVSGEKRTRVRPQK